MGLEVRKPVLGVCEQQKHPCSLISAFVIHLLESVISNLAASEISILASVAKQACLNMAWSEILRQVFSRQGPYSNH